MRLISNWGLMMLVETKIFGFGTQKNLAVVCVEDIGILGGGWVWFLWLCLFWYPLKVGGLWSRWRDLRVASWVGIV